LGVEQSLSGSRHSQHVAEAGENHPRFMREGDAIVDAPHRDHTYGTARAVDQLDVRGQQIVDAVLVDRVSVPAAHLHDLVVTVGIDRGEDLPGDRSAELRISELVHEPQADTSTLPIPETPVLSAARPRAVPA